MLSRKELAALLKRADALNTQVSINDVADRILLSNNSRFLSLPVIDSDSKPLGMISRYQLQHIFLQRYGRELWGRRAVSELMNTSPLLISLTMSIGEAAARVTAHVHHPITEDFIFVDDEGRYQGIGIVLDLLKAMSDALGHAAGDILLKQVAQRLSGVIRSSDTVARLGGDEFTIILENIDTDSQARFVAEQILGAFREKFQLGERDIAVSTSIGVALYPVDANDLNNLLKSADAAMYRAKEQGRDSYHFCTAELNGESDRRFQLEHGLRSAMAIWRSGRSANCGQSVSASTASGRLRRRGARYSFRHRTHGMPSGN